MTANLTPDYFAAEKRFKEARTPSEKLTALKEMLSALPKHKGTEKMQADLKRRIKAATEEAQKKTRGARSNIPSVAPEGMGQLVLVGAPNSGKSALVARVSGAPIEVADYPYTTRLPQPGMLRYEDLQFQLVDMPPISAEYMESWVPTLVRSADGVLLVADLDDPDLLGGLEVAEHRLSERRIDLVRPAPGVRPRPAQERVSMPTLLVGTKLDRPGARDNLEVLADLYGTRFPVVPVSVESGEGLDRLARAVFELRDIVRVYTKQPGKKPDMDSPFVVARGSTVMDLAEKVHKELAARLAFARIWAPGKYDGQRVPRDHVLADRDVIELHD
jgi:ribosome-interacting GTPase 1